MDALGLAVARLIVKYLLSGGDPVIVAVDGRGGREGKPDGHGMRNQPILARWPAKV